MKSILLKSRQFVVFGGFWVFFMTFSAFAASAQNSESLLKKGTKEYDLGNIPKAQKYFEQSLKADMKNFEARFFLAVCYLESHARQPAKALKILKTVKPSAIEASQEAYRYYLAMAYHQNLNFDKALEVLEKVRGKDVGYKTVRRLRENIEQAKLNYDVPRKGLVVKNLGRKINSRDMEYSAVMMDNYRTILYTARRPRTRTGNMSEDGLTYEVIYKVSLDENDRWSRPIEVMNDIKPKHHNATVQMMPEEGKLVVYRDGNLFMTDLVEGSWVQGEKIKPISSIAYESHCFIADGGKTIYYSSNLESKNGDLDIYVTHQDRDGNWKKPRPVPGANTPYDEDSPFLAKDGTLYFSSKGHNSMGGFDIFSLPYDSTTRRWGKPQNLGYPINTVFDDIFFNISDKYAYMSSARTSGRGSLDLLGVYLFDRIRIKGRVIDSKLGSIEGAKITMKHGEELYQTSSGEQGHYEIVIPFEKTLDVIVNTDTDTLIRDRLNVNIYFGEREEEYNFLIQRAEDMEVDTSGKAPVNYYTINNDSTDNGKKAKFENGAFSLKYFTINDISNDDLINSEETPDEYLITASQLLAAELTDEEEELAKKESEDAITSAPTFTPFRLFYAFDKQNITSDYYSNLDNLIAYLKKYPNKKAILTGHTDSSGPLAYNLKLSIERAKTAAQYLLDKGVNADQLIIEGKGESEPDESNETPLGRSRNRRVTIMVR